MGILIVTQRPQLTGQAGQLGLLRRSIIAGLQAPLQVAQLGAGCYQLRGCLPGFSYGLLQLGFAPLLCRLRSQLAIQVPGNSLQTLALCLDLATAGGIGPVRVGQRLALRLKLGQQFIPVLIRKRLSAERALGLAGFPLQPIQLFLTGVHLGPQLLVANLQTG